MGEFGPGHRGYKGLIDLARRSGQIVSIAAHEVCTNDKFELVYGLDEKLSHTPALDDRGDVMGFYAVAKLRDGGHAFEFMSLRQILEIRDASQGYRQAVKFGKQDSHPWSANFIEMGRKTVIRRLAKYLPLSIEFQTAAALDGLAEAGKDQHLDAFDGDYSIIGPVEHIDEETGEITAVEAVEEKPEPEKPEVRPPERPAKSRPKKIRRWRWPMSGRWSSYCLQCYNFLWLDPLRTFDFRSTVHPSTHQPGDSK